MNRSAFISLLLFGAAGTGCALLIGGTYVVLHIPLPFSVLLSCVVMTTAVAMMAFRLRKAKPEPGDAYAFASSPQSHPAPFRAPAESRLLLLPAGEDERVPNEDAPRAKQHRDTIQIEAITLFELPRHAREQEAA